MSKKELPKLTKKQEKFIHEYIKDYNSCRAAKAAGYSERSAHAQGSENLRKPAIKAVLKELQLKSKEILEEDFKISEKNIVSELCTIAFANMRNYATWGKYENQLGEKHNYLDLKPSETLMPKYTAAIEQIKTSPMGGTVIKLHSKTKAIELLMKKMGLLNEEARNDDEATKRDHEAIADRVLEVLEQNKKEE